MLSIIKDLKVIGGINIIKLVAIDMDETLLRTDKSFDKDRFLEIYEEFKKRDMILAIASGNNYARLDAYFSYMSHDDLYFAADNGNYTVKRGEVLRKNIINHEDIIAAVDMLESLSDFSLVYSDGANVYSTWVNPEYEEYILSFNQNLQLIDSLDDIKNKDILKVACHSPLSLEEAKEVSQKIIEDFPELDAVTSGGGWMDFYHIGGGKGSAVKALQDKYGITKKETMVFGDSLNDASLAYYAKYSVVMSNGDEELKDIFSYEIGSNNDQSVFDVLEKVLKTESADFMEEYKI